ncbi:MAG TPA: hypothetical protein VGM53_07295 [Streptosporangiaceae bacterium]
MENTLAALRDGKPTTVVYETTFLITWPMHLGGTSGTVDFAGSMQLIPSLGFV